ncbi:MAG: acyl-CoA thioesterase [Alphaproteobacteria bacterium]|jgi:acyl-CoA thioesterase YciA
MVTDTPTGTLCLQTAAMPADTNPNGDIFGGWLMAQMDIAGGIAARPRAGGRIVTIAVDAMVFHKPVHVGDVVCVYADLERVGRTSLAYRIEAWVIRRDSLARDKVTEGRFTYVAIDDSGRPRPVPRDAETMEV